MCRYGFVELVSRRDGTYRVVPLSAEEVEELERCHGTRELVEERRLDAQRESLNYLDWLNRWDDAEELVAGTGF
jgi:hypothetical protein